MKLNNKKPAKPIIFTRRDLRGFAEQVADRSSIVFSHAKQRPYLVLNALDPKLADRLHKALRKAYSERLDGSKPTFGSSLPEQGVALVLGRLTVRACRCRSCAEPYRMLDSGPLTWFKGHADVTAPIQRVLSRRDRTPAEVPVCPSCGRADEAVKPRPHPALAELERLAEETAALGGIDAL